MVLRPDVRAGRGSGGAAELRTSTAPWYGLGMTAWERREDGAETVQTNVRMPRDLHERLRRTAFDLKISQGLIVEEALTTWLGLPEEIRLWVRLQACSGACGTALVVEEALVKLREAG